MASDRLTVSVSVLDAKPVFEALRLLLSGVREARELCIFEPDSVREFLDDVLDKATACLFEEREAA